MDVSPREAGLAVLLQDSGSSAEDATPRAGAQQMTAKAALLRAQLAGGGLPSGSDGQIEAMPVPCTRDGAWAAPSKPEVDAEDDDGSEGRDFIGLVHGSDETAEVAEDSSLPLNQARQLTPMQTKLAQQAHAQ